MIISFANNGVCMHAYTVCYWCFCKFIGCTLNCFYNFIKLIRSVSAIKIIVFVLLLNCYHFVPICYIQSGGLRSRWYVLCSLTSPKHWDRLNLLCVTHNTNTHCMQYRRLITVHGRLSNKSQAC